MHTEQHTIAKEMGVHFIMVVGPVGKESYPRSTNLSFSSISEAIGSIYVGLECQCVLNFDNVFHWTSLVRGFLVVAMVGLPLLHTRASQDLVLPLLKFCVVQLFACLII
jgi:hypothetical protein